MTTQTNQIISETIPNQAAMNSLLGRLFDVVKPDAIFSQPIQSGEHTVITASEVTVAMGAGFGGGFDNQTSDDNDVRLDGGGGGGGGGIAMARPVAAIIIKPNGVHVEPIVDATKIALAFFTTIGAMIFTLRKMRQKMG